MNYTEIQVFLTLSNKDIQKNMYYAIQISFNRKIKFPQRVSGDLLSSSKSPQMNNLAEWVNHQK